MVWLLWCVGAFVRPPGVFVGGKVGAFSNGVAEMTGLAPGLIPVAADGVLGVLLYRGSLGLSVLTEFLVSLYLAFLCFTSIGPRGRPTTDGK